MPQKSHLRRPKILCLASQMYFFFYIGDVESTSMDVDFSKAIDVEFYIADVEKKSMMQTGIL